MKTKKPELTKELIELEYFLQRMNEVVKKLRKISEYHQSRDHYVVSDITKTMKSIQAIIDSKLLREIRKQKYD